jgi:adenylate cyclase
LSFLNELKRRNVLRVAAAYLVSAWLVIQVVETIFPAFGFGDAAVRIVTVVFAIGLIPILIFAWAFELTPEGLKKDSEVDRSQSIAPHTGRKLDRMIMVVLALALGYFAFDKFVLTPQREAAKAEQVAEQVAQARLEGRTEARVESYGDTSIAVLAFDDMSPEGDQAYLSDGIAEEMLNLLTKIPELRVISRSSAFYYKGKGIKLAQVAEELNVDHILEGSVRKAGNRVRITVQLVEARSDTQLWSETYERMLDDIFAIQDDIAAQVIGQLKLTLLGSAPRSLQTDPEAYTLYLLAQDTSRKADEKGLEKSNALGQQALAIDPDYAPAWILLAGNYSLQALTGQRPEAEGLRLAHEALQTALEVDPDYAPAYSLLGWIAMSFENDLVAATRYYKKALDMEPANSDFINGSALLLAGLNRPDEAVDLLEYVITRDPLNPARHYNLGLAYFYANRWQEAITSLQTAQRLSPDLIDIDFAIGLALIFNGEPEAALAAFERQQNGPYRTMGRAMAMYRLGRIDEYRSSLETLIESRGDTRPAEVAQVFAFIGDADAAFTWLDKAAEKNDPRFNIELTLPIYNPIKTDPRWAPFLDRVGSSQAQLDAIEFNVMLPE